MTLLDRLAALATVSPAQLRSEWRAVYKAVPPQLTADLLMRGIAYRLQEREHGGLDAISKRELARLGNAVQASALQAAADITLRPGTRLIRSWHGVTYSVLVVEGGFLFEDRTYGSLTAIAKAITGLQWSGPRFFGLKGRSGA